MAIRRKQKPAPKQPPEPEETAGDIERVWKETETDAPRPVTVPVQAEADTDEDTADDEQPANDFEEAYGKPRSSDRTPARIERAGSSKKRIFLLTAAIVAVVLLAVTAAGFYVFANRDDAFSGEQVTIAMQAPQEIVSGGETTLTFEVRNGEQVGIQDAELTLQLPDGFSFVSSVPQPLNAARNAWSLGAVGDGSLKTLSVTGKFYGAIAETQTIDARLTYSPSNFSSEFQTAQNFTVTITSSIMSVTIDAPGNVVSGQPADYAVTVTNTSDGDLGSIRLLLTLPEGMAVDRFTPPPTVNADKRWELGTLAGGAEQKITFTATLTANEGEMRELRAEAGYADASSNFQKQADETKILFVADPRLTLSLAANGATEDSTAVPGDDVEYLLTVTNGSKNAEFKDVTVGVTLTDRGILEWDQLVDSQQGTLNGNTIVWTGTEVAALKEMDPGATATITFSVPITDEVTIDDAAENNSAVVAVATAEAGSVTDLEDSSLAVRSDDVTVRVDSSVALRAGGRYYNDQLIAVGKGPVPPQAGESTTYYIYWNLANGANELNDVTVSAELPEDVTWTNGTAVSAGEIAYEEETRTVTWTINRVPAGVGTILAELEASFGVRITPVAADIGTVPILLEPATLSATDSFTANTLTVEKEMITAALDGDPLASGKGKVIVAPTTNTE